MREGNFSRDISYVNALDEQNELRNSVPLPVIRKFINSAVYVEAQATRMPSIKFNPLHFGDCPMDRPMSAKSYKVKTCVCSSDEESCPCHAFSLHRSSSVKFSSLSTKSSNDSGFATKPPSCTTVALQLSLTSINTNSIANTNGDEAKKRFAEWLSRKKEEQLRKELKEKHMKKKQEKEKQQRIERERENFIHWLNKKRKEEEMKKLQKLREEEAERAKRVNEEEIARERERGYRAWLRRKEQEALERKNEEKSKEDKRAEEMELRLKESERRYQEWLQNSKCKPKPLTLNQGLESLRASVSLAYINPVPWVPNIPQPQGPH